MKYVLMDAAYYGFSDLFEWAWKYSPLDISSYSVVLKLSKKLAFAGNLKNLNFAMQSINDMILELRANGTMIISYNLFEATIFESCAIAGNYHVFKWIKLNYPNFKLECSHIRTILEEVKNPTKCMNKIKETFTFCPWDPIFCRLFSNRLRAIEIIQDLKNSGYEMELPYLCAIALNRKRNSKFYEWFSEWKRSDSYSNYFYEHLIYKAAILNKNFEVIKFLKMKGCSTEIYFNVRIQIREKTDLRKIESILNNVEDMGKIINDLHF